ncbi:MAG: hypothetical protein AAB545_01095 [Patescibacteria group bacterium]
MKTYIEKRKSAILLRKKGYSYSYIQKTLSISKSTINYWLADVPYVPNEETIRFIGEARAASGAAKNRIRLLSIQEAKAEALKKLGSLSQRDIFLLGLGLYIGEGSKTDGIVRITNSDYRIIQFAILWFKNSFFLGTKNFSVRLHLYPDTNEKEALDFWFQKIGIPLGQFQKSQVDYRQDKKVSRRGKLPYGTAHLSIRSGGVREFGVFLSREISAMMDSVLENPRV